MSTEIRQSDLLSQVSFLQSDLSRINSNLSGRPEDEQEGLSGQAAEARHLIKQLEAYKSSVAAGSIEGKSEPSDGQPAAEKGVDGNGQVMSTSSGCKNYAFIELTPYFFNKIDIDI